MFKTQKSHKSSFNTIQYNAMQKGESVGLYHLNGTSSRPSFAKKTHTLCADGQ